MRAGGTQGGRGVAEALCLLPLPRAPPPPPPPHPQAVIPLLPIPLPSQVLNQFGPLSPDIVEAQRYAAWKAADIRKALREGRAPLPGPPATWGLLPGAVAGSAGDGAPALPTPPPAPPGLDRSDSALGTGPGGDVVVTLAPPRFAPGDAVFYCPDGHGPPARGVISGGPFPPEGLGHTYALTLGGGGGGGGDSGGEGEGQAVRAFEVQLAPDVAPGAPVTLGPLPPPALAGAGAVAAPPPPPKDAPPPGPATVEALVDPGAWRPAYRVRAEGARKAVVVSDTRLGGWPRPGGGGSGGGGGGAGAVPPPAPPSTASPPPFAAPHAIAPHPPTAPPAPPSAPPAAPPPPPMPPLSNLTEAQKLAKYAASSIGFEDVGTAVGYLQEALRLLTVAGASPAGGKGKR